MIHYARFVTVPRAVATGSYESSTMKLSYIDFNNEHIPLAYLISFRGYGTWLHGAAKGSIDRFHNRYGAPMLPPNECRQRHERGLLKQPPVTLNSRQRKAVQSAIRETCSIRSWTLWAHNIRTNHVHAVVSAKVKPDMILSSLKANATRTMRAAGCWKSDVSPWAYRGSKKYLWTEKQLTDGGLRTVRSRRAAPMTGYSTGSGTG